MPVQPQHIEAIRQWRNAQLSILRQSVPISPGQQAAYYAARVWPAMKQMQPADILLACLEDERLIGYGGLVHIAWEHRRAEVSFLLDPELARESDAYARYFGTFLDLMKALAFEDLGLGRIFTETYAMRTHHISVLEANGFRLEGRLRNHVIVDDRPMDALIHGCLDGSDTSGETS